MCFTPLVLPAVQLSLQHLSEELLDAEAQHNHQTTQWVVNQILSRIEPSDDDLLLDAPTILQGIKYYLKAAENIWCEDAMQTRTRMMGGIEEYHNNIAMLGRGDLITI